MQTKQEIGFSYCEETKALKDNLEKGFLALGERLKRIRDEKLYMPVHENFWAFLQEDIKISESMASRLITVFEKLILGYGVSQETVIELGGWSEAYQVAKLAHSKKEAEELIDKLKLLPPSEQRKELADYKAGGVCQHEWNEIHIKQCKLCGLKEKVYDQN